MLLILFFNDEIAFKYRMSSMQAALGLAQLERVEELVARKREIFRWYEEGLGDLEGAHGTPSIQRDVGLATTVGRSRDEDSDAKLQNVGAGSTAKLRHAGHRRSSSHDSSV